MEKPLKDTARRIAGLHREDAGGIAAVWLAHDPDTDVVRLYDCVRFKNDEVMAVIREGLNARGRWIAIAWPAGAEDLAEMLLDSDCNMMRDAVKDSPTLADMTVRAIRSRMRSGRFKVDKRLSEWLEEYNTYFKEKAQVPRDSAPLMAATRHAMAMLDFAIAPARGGNKTALFPKVPMI